MLTCSSRPLWLNSCRVGGIPVRSLLQIEMTGPKIKPKEKKMFSWCAIKEGQMKFKKKKRSRIIELLLCNFEPCLSPPPTAAAVPTPQRYTRSPSDSHSTRRVCSLFWSPGAREGWLTAQVMWTLSSLELTVRESLLLTLYVSPSGRGSAMYRWSEETGREKKKLFHFILHVFKCHTFDPVQ